MQQAFSDDWFLDGRLLLRQPVKGHRVGTDALLLAAITPAQGRVCDLGSGVGAIGLALALDGTNQVVLVERDPVFADHARHNITLAGLGEQVRLVQTDVFDRKAFLQQPELADQSFDAVATNPPFDQALRGRASPSPLKQAAHAMQGGNLTEWLKAGARLLKDGGVLTLIHRADRLADILQAMPRRLGGVTILPVQPLAEQVATRLLIAATAGSRAALTLLPPLILHGRDGCFMPDIEQVHQGRAAISMRTGLSVLSQ